jgi:hypothetical protein
MKRKTSYIERTGEAINKEPEEVDPLGSSLYFLPGQATPMTGYFHRLFIRPADSFGLTFGAFLPFRGDFDL